MALAGWLMVGGFATFLAGAARWRPEYEQPYETALPLMHEDRRRLRWIQWWMIPAMFVTTSGLVALAASEPVPSTAIAAVVFAMGAVLWVMSLLFRLSVGEWAAERTHASGEVPDPYPPLARWAGLAYGVHMVSAYVVAMLLGWAVVDRGLASQWVGWGTVAWGAVLAILFLVPRTRGGASPPIMAHVATLAVGIALLV